jgi:hypothetical protein
MCGAGSALLEVPADAIGAERSPEFRNSFEPILAVPYGGRKGTQTFPLIVIGTEQRAALRMRARQGALRSWAVPDGNEHIGGITNFMLCVAFREHLRIDGPL